MTSAMVIKEGSYRRSGNFRISKFCSIKFSVYLIFVVSLSAQIVRID